MSTLCCSLYGHNLTSKHMPDKVTDSQICNWQNSRNDKFAPDNVRDWTLYHKNN